LVPLVLQDLLDLKVIAENAVKKVISAIRATTVT
jgi:hypothetical protein